MFIWSFGRIFNVDHVLAWDII